jgi:dimethylaniline monooxygenase (N-oxide forming)
VCVIGAGMSGLAAIRELLRAGHEVSAFEAGSELGGMWRYANDSGMSAAYASLSTNTSRRRMQYPSLPMSKAAGQFPHRSQMLAYLEAYAERNGLGRQITFGAPVLDARAVESGWEVTVGERPTRRFDAVVVAGGHYWDPQIPKLEGEFAGTLMHAREYRTPEPFAGQRVVVVGGGQSAIDVVAEISTTAERAILACSRPHHLVPRRVLGRPFDEFDTAPTQFLPLPLTRLLMRAMIGVSRAAPERGELPSPDHPLFETRWPVVVSATAAEALKARAFVSRPHVRALAGERVRFVDGSEEQADTIVFATGYHINFPFLTGERARGRGWEFPLYRRILAPEEPGLAFVGVLEPGPGLFAIVERQARWLGEVLAGRLSVPERAGMWRAIDAGGERRSRRQFGATGRHTLLCNRHAYMRVLARDLRRGAAR